MESGHRGVAPGPSIRKERGTTATWRRDRECKISCITFLDVLCGSLTRDGTRGGKVDLKALRASGMSPQDLPDALSMIRLPLAGRKESSLVEMSLYRTLVNGLYFARSLVEVLLDSDPIFLRLKLADLWEVFSTLEPLGQADQVAVMKYWTAWPMAKWLRNPLPKRPSCLPLVQSSLEFPLWGPMRKHFRNLLVSRTTSVRAGTVFTGILQGVKRGCAAVPEEFEVLSCLKHKASLSVPVPLTHASSFAHKFDAIWGVARKCMLGKVPTIDREGLKARWRKVFLNRNIRRRLFNASNHACIEHKRSEGGRREIIYRANRTLVSDEHDRRLISDPPLLDMFVRNGRVVERRGWPLASYETFLKYAAESTRDRPLRAQVELCLEPLKCRVITKGEAVPYFVAQTFQKAAWGALQDIDAMRLTSCPVDASMLYGLELQTKRLDLPFDEWVSGDYSAATDGLSLEVNQECLSSMLNAFDATPEESEVCRKVLGCHQVSYPDRIRTDEDGLEPFVMLNGQLMGSVLSFPVLCAINLAAYWCALEEYTDRTFKKDELPVLVNGDDILFKANKAFYEVWQKWITRAGFTLSVGKNYISPHYITVNSESWLHKGGSTFVKLPFLNCGLLLQEAVGPEKVALRKETAERPLIPKLQWILDNANNPVRAYDRIKHHWRRSLAIHTEKGRYSLCAPTELGGCGLLLPAVCRPAVYFTAFQQLLAGRSHAVYKDFNGNEIRECPSTGLERLAAVALPTPLNPVSTEDRLGEAVLRCKTEPIRGENEVRFGDPKSTRRVVADLNTAQVPLGVDRAIFKLRIIPRRRLAAVFAAETKIKSPFSFDLEIRKQLAQGPTDDASLLFNETEKIVEMATDNLSIRTSRITGTPSLGVIKRW